MSPDLAYFIGISVFLAGWLLFVVGVFALLAFGYDEDEYVQ